VIALEPDPQNLKACQTNIAEHQRVNGLANITLRSSAVGDINGLLPFSSEGSMGSAAAVIVGGGRGSVIHVEAVTLDQLVLDYQLERVAFVKMDIEGMELGVLQRAEAFLRRFRPRLVIEPHYVAGVLTTDGIVSCLTGCGYACEVIEQYGVALPLITAVPNAASGESRASGGYQ